MLSTWETPFAAVAARLLSLLALLNFSDIFPALFERLIGEEMLATAASEVPDRQWQPYLSRGDPADQYAVETAFGVLSDLSLVQWRDDQRLGVMRGVGLGGCKYELRKHWRFSAMDCRGRVFNLLSFLGNNL